MSDYNITIDQTTENVKVIIDDKNPNLGAYYALLHNINSNYNNISNVTNNVMALSSKWVETALEMDTLQEATTAKWIETATEMDTMQIAFSGGWQDTTEYINKGVIDMGFF
jgi:hypothetical protein